MKSKLCTSNPAYTPPLCKQHSAAALHTPAAWHTPYATLQARYSVQQHEQAQRAMQLKISLLEEQLAATAESARRRMEEQLDTFRGDAMTARSHPVALSLLGRRWPGGTGTDAAHASLHGIARLRQDSRSLQEAACHAVARGCLCIEY